MVLKKDFERYIEDSLNIIGILYTELASKDHDNYALDKADHFRENTDKKYINLILED